MVKVIYGNKKFCWNKRRTDLGGSQMNRESLFVFIIGFMFEGKKQVLHI